VTSPTALYARLAKVEKGDLPATAYTPPQPAPKNVMLSYNVAGPYSWVCPVGVTRVKATVTGGGGGAGGSTSSIVFSSGAGGATAIGIVAVIPGTTYTIVVGAGGAGGSPGNSGLNGGSSSAFGMTGEGGTGNGVVTGATALATGGTLNIAGGDGMDGPNASISFTPAINGGASFWGGGPSSGSMGMHAMTPGTGGAPATAGAGTGGNGADGVVVLEY
jgi:hypothetical protein